MANQPADNTHSVKLGASAQYAQIAVKHWLDTERAYATTKLDDSFEDEHLEDWLQFVSQYLDRAVIFSLALPAGRQALMKALMTLHRFAEAAVRNYGELPVAGVPSGDITMPVKRVP